MCGWGLVVSQQHRLVGIAPTLAPILIALNAAAIYFAVSASGAVGALAMKVLGPHDLPFLSTILILGGILSAETAHRLIQDDKTGRLLRTNRYAPPPARSAGG
jgi:predicted MFS family arabinose efflux permease